MVTQAADGLREPSHAETVLARLDATRAEVAALLTDAARWAAEARRQREAADGLATALRDLTEQTQRSETIATQARAEADALAGERDTLMARLRRTDAALEQARAETAAQAQRVVEGGERSKRLAEETCRLHAVQLVPLGEPDTLFDNILEVSVELAGAEKGAYLRPAKPFEILATEQLEEARPDSPLLDAVAAQVAERREPVILNAADEIAAFADDPLAASLRNLVGYPIIVRERLTGVVIVANKLAGQFTEDDTRLLLGIGSHAGVALENRRLRREIEAASAGTVALLCDVIEAKDPYTHGHCEQVAALSLATARELGLGPADQHAVAKASLLHDVGKIAVSDGVLLKPGPLLVAERELIEAHAAVGADLVDRVPTLRNLAPIIRHHHERWDGTGYPDRLAGEAIPRLARILGVADAYEAMRSDRPYRPARSPEDAREELRREAGGQFDPAAVEAVLRALDAPGAVERAGRDVLGEAWSTTV